jgi:phosphatidylserine decarboxylase
MNQITSRLFLLIQRIIPRSLLTSLIFRIARIRSRWFKDFLIRQFIAAYKVNTEEAQLSVPDDFACFNDFFIRELKEGSRPIATADDAIVSPADGTVSAAGRIDKDRVFQAKGLHYTLTDLLATDLADANRYIDGAFATIYLAPYNYHRVHSPYAGKLVAARYIPGDLFSVNAATVSLLPNLFTRNERLICQFETVVGPMAVVFVGAMNVGSISTPWSGEIRPRKRGVADDIDIQANGIDQSVTKGGLLGWFNMGSTVIVLLPPGITDNFAALASGQKVHMGEVIGSVEARQA